MKKREIIYQSCKYCGGQGTLPGPKSGRVLRSERESRDLSMEDLVPHFGYKTTYISDLENDRRPWNNTLVEKYRAAIEAAVELRLREEAVSANTN